MFIQAFKTSSRSRTALSAALFAFALLLLGGCAPGYSTRDGGHDRGYVGTRTCYQGCGRVQEISQVRLDDDNAVLGTVIGALVGGVLGNQVGGGTGKTAATVAGAAAGGYVGHEVAQRRGGKENGWRIVVRLDNGQYATVTQRNPPRVRVGDYVMVRDNEVYPAR